MRMTIRMIAVLGVAATLAARAQTHVLDQTIATELLRGATGEMAVGALQSSPDFARMYTTSVLEQELAQEAAMRGLGERLDVQRALMTARYTILIQALQQDVARGTAQPTDAEVEAQYKKNRAEYKLPEAVKADVVILDGTETNALEVARAAALAQTIDPENLKKTRFQELARADQVWVARDVFPEDVWKQVREMEKGRVSFFRMPNSNYMIVKYEDYRAERPATLDEAKDGIRNQMAGERQRKAWEDYLEATRTKLGLTEKK